MIPPDQKAFLGRIRQALGHAPHESRNGSHLFMQGPSREELQILERYRQRTAKDREELLEQLMEAAKPVHLCVRRLPDPEAAGAAIAALVQEKAPEPDTVKQVVAWRHGLIDGLDLHLLPEQSAVRVHRTPPLDPLMDPARRHAEREAQRRAIAKAHMGVTAADFCMADTATLVLRARPGQPRSVALLPPVHVAVITLDQILWDMKELFALLRWEARFAAQGLSRYMAFISGPSKTADIEATMVHGAHGPREVHLFVVASAPGRLQYVGQRSTFSALTK